MSYIFHENLKLLFGIYNQIIMYRKNSITQINNFFPTHVNSFDGFYYQDLMITFAFFR